MIETNVPHTELADSTRDRLLEAAGEVFAAHGFRDATIRDICARAGANLAAVNYHFGGKERLYAEVLKYADDRSMRGHPLVAGFEHLSAETQLGAFVRQFMQRIFDPTRPGWPERVMAREMIDPTPALVELAEKNIKPRAQMLQRIVRRLIGESATDRDVQMCAASIVGQCLLYHKSKELMGHLMPDLPLKDGENIDVLSAHITRFSLAAMSIIANGPTGGDE